MSQDQPDSVDDDEHLWRRIASDHYIPVEGGGMRISSGAWKTRELSLDRASILQRLGLDASFTGRGGVGVADLTAAEYRSKGMNPVPDPLPENSAHAIVEGKITNSQATAMSRWCTFIPNPE